MTSFIDPHFIPSHLLYYQGYHLQVFTSGRAKISLQREGRHKHDYYCERPKKDREAYRRQKARSYAALPEHFDRVDALLAAHRRAVVFRVHAKGDNNATADNAHLIATQDALSLWWVFGSVVHEWEVPFLVLGGLLSGRGPKIGAASIFNEYSPSYDHDWEDICFAAADYRQGYRAPDAGALPQVATLPRLAEPAHHAPQPVREVYPPQPQPYETMPDGGLVEPYEDEPDPEDWAAWQLAEARQEFESVGGIVGQPRVQNDQQVKPYSAGDLWAMIQSKNTVS